MKTLLRTLIVALGLVVVVGGSTPAHAAMSYSAGHSCGVNYRCNIWTNSSVNASVEHSYNGVVVGYWMSGGSHSSSRNVSGWTRAEAYTGGTFQGKGSSCTCRSGCGV